jgi:hypothetical protein
MMTNGPAYSDVNHLHGETDGSSLSEWERLSLAALRSHALYRDAIMKGEPFAAAEWWSLYHLDRASARMARKRAGH